MARKFRFPNGNFGWNPEKCEDTLITCAYEEIKPYISTAEKIWEKDFEKYFYDRGTGVGFYLLDQINVVRRRRNLVPLELKETDVSDYARTKENTPLKIEHRRQIREDWSTMSKADREKTMAYAKDETDRLPPPHQPFEEWEANQPGNGGEATTNGLTATEVKRRTAATKPPKLALERAARMLTLATDPALREDIISRLAADDALEVAERFPAPEDAPLRDALVRRALG